MIARLLACILIFAVGCSTATSSLTDGGQASCSLDLRALATTLTQIQIDGDWTHLTADVIRDSPWARSPDRTVDASANVLSTARLIGANGCVCCESARFVNGRVQELAFAYVLPSRSAADDAMRLLLPTLLTHQEVEEVFSEFAAGAPISRAIRRPLPPTGSLGQRQLMIDVNIQPAGEDDRVGLSVTIFFGGNYAF